jgi:phosphohistidine phosphatase SixA
MNATAPPDRRRLIIMRHAKSSHESDAATDHARPLNKRGRRDAPRVARHLAEIGWPPDFILSSDALRTRETLEGLQHGFGATIAHMLSAPLYAGGYPELLSVARRIPASAETVLALGHNPGWEDAVEVLSGKAVVLKTATCALLILSESSPWPEALRRCGDWRLENVVYPKDI